MHEMIFSSFETTNATLINITNVRILDTNLTSLVFDTDVDRVG
jgi:hypothetical protein